MKKIILLFAVLGSLLQSVHAQEKGNTTRSENTRAIQKGQSTVNLYYGYTVSKGFYEGLVANSGVEVSVKTKGPIGLVYEYLLSDVVGIGAEFGYQVTTISYKDYYGFNNTGYYEEQIKVTKIRAQIRANFHFLKNPNFDMYGLVSLGYRQNTYLFTTNNPNDPGTTFDGLVPFGFKPGLGFRYFFDGPIGLHLEIAAGTPVVAGGLSLRF